MELNSHEEKMLAERSQAFKEGYIHGPSMPAKYDKGTAEYDAYQAGARDGYLRSYKFDPEAHRQKQRADNPEFYALHDAIDEYMESLGLNYFDMGVYGLWEIDEGAIHFSGAKDGEARIAWLIEEEEVEVHNNLSVAQAKVIIAKYAERLRNIEAA